MSCTRRFSACVKLSSIVNTIHSLNEYDIKSSILSVLGGVIDYITSVALSVPLSSTVILNFLVLPEVEDFRIISVVLIP